jgi:hypothetical protein
MKISPTVAAMSALFAVSLPHRVAADCLEYGPNRLSGTIARQTYPGPPDYESVTRGDEPLVVWVLVLDRRICVADPTHRLPKSDYQREVQLLLDDAQYEQYRKLLGQRVTVTGALQPGHADHKWLLIVPREIVRIPY